jgi:hypothetical protein
MKVGLEVGIKEVDPTCLSPVSMQDERVLSEVRRYIAKIIKKTTRTTREQLKKVSLANLLNCFLYHFGRFAKIPKLNCPKLSRLSLYIKIMLLEIEAMLLDAKGLPLHAEA